MFLPVFASSAPFAVDVSAIQNSDEPFSETFRMCCVPRFGNGHENDLGDTGLADMDVVAQM
ncbi:hypothetical protein AW736_01260 [Termitidicoccus mucosus]|uniref:Uncharacterized protein n=1 Tax=Termitidicoccus mucosus TaxID=1184151 RepID=A0A178IQ28_9BACT|nr:hypothetical protein AW736_01260 [Opitutaceae bacterium TSB47]